MVAVVGIDAELPSDSLRLICQISTHQTFQYQQQHKMMICLEDFARGLLVELSNFSAVYILTLPPRCSQRCNPSGWKDKRRILRIEWITGMRWQLWEAPGPIIKPAEQVLADTLECTRLAFMVPAEAISQHSECRLFQSYDPLSSALAPLISILSLSLNDFNVFVTLKHADPTELDLTTRRVFLPSFTLKLPSPSGSSHPYANANAPPMRLSQANGHGHGIGSSRYGGLGIPGYDYGYDQGFLLLTPESSTMQKRNLQATLVEKLKKMEEEVRARDLEGEEDEGESTEGNDGDGTETEGEGNGKKRHQYEWDHKKASKPSLKKKSTKTLGSDDASSTNTNSASSSPTTSSSTTASTRRPSLKKKKSSSNTKGTKKTLHLSPSTLTDIYELSTGNRGGVMKVKHIETGMVLAKKVSLSVPFFVFISVVVAIIGYFIGVIVDMGTMGWLPFPCCWNYGLGICQNLRCGDYEVPLELVLKAEIVLIDAKPQIRKQLLCELHILHTCTKHSKNKVTGAKYIVTSYGAYLQEPNICICMEFMDRGSFNSLYKSPTSPLHGPIPINILRRVAQSVLEGLDFFV
ncbi:hypothetical protein D9758_015068 [Tetrapyrgos nigripes]|uniref:Protein kinase domain-containing protein n=1 Tax=Tetrapyrgos nigripes TaxID=182062 RepID=A0A8H5CUU0_9AGAR|nr:hypothetical protein D9758_015068 [Tetrapyrgos nigripes]